MIFGENNRLEWQSFQQIYQNLGIGIYIPNRYIYDVSPDLVMNDIEEHFSKHGESFKAAYFKNLHTYYVQLTGNKDYHQNFALSKKMELDVQYYKFYTLMIGAAIFSIYAIVESLGIGIFIGLGVMFYSMYPIYRNKSDVKLLQSMLWLNYSFTIKDYKEIENTGAGEKLFNLMVPMRKKIGLTNIIHFYFSPENGIQAEANEYVIDKQLKTRYVKISRNLFQMAFTNSELFLAIMAHELCHFLQNDLKVRQHYFLYSGFFSERDVISLGKYLTMSEVWADLGSVVFSENFKIFDVFENFEAYLGERLKLDGIHPSLPARSKALKVVLAWNLEQTINQWQLLL